MRVRKSSRRGSWQSPSTDSECMHVRCDGRLGQVTLCPERTRHNSSSICHVLCTVLIGATELVVRVPHRYALHRIMLAALGPLSLRWRWTNERHRMH